MNRISKYSLVFACLLFASCSGGGGGDESGSSDGGSSNDGGSGVVTGSARTWRVTAPVTTDGCGERIAAVNQLFDVTQDGDTVTVDDTLVTLSGPATSDGFTVGFSGVSGDCVRDYAATFSNMTDLSANVHMTVTSKCGASVCENVWDGTAAPEPAPAKTSEVEKPKVTGTNCVPPVPEIGYRPSLYECFGNSAVLARGFVRSAYSIVVRRIGQFNDRDPRNTGCATNRCSPYKTQQKIELPEYQVNCLGDSGFSDLFSEVTRISVKFTAAVNDSLDPSQFQQYCLAKKKSSLN